MHSYTTMSFGDAHAAVYAPACHRIPSSQIREVGGRPPSLPSGKTSIMVVRALGADVEAVNIEKGRVCDMVVRRLEVEVDGRLELQKAACKY